MTKTKGTKGAEKAQQGKRWRVWVSIYSGMGDTTKKQDRLIDKAIEMILHINGFQTPTGIVLTSPYKDDLEEDCRKVGPILEALSKETGLNFLSDQVLEPELKDWCPQVLNLS
jgi:hypothetical protein